MKNPKMSHLKTHPAHKENQRQAGAPPTGSPFAHVQPLVLRGLGMLALLFLVFFPPSVSATHFTGGEITYRHLTGTNYVVTLRMYRDCIGIQFRNPEILNVTPSAGGASRISLPEVSVREITPICPTATSTCNGGTVSGIEERIFETVFSFPALPAGQSYTISSTNCCRNFGITTLNAPGSTGWYIQTTLDPNQPLPSRNSSPVFQNPPVAFLCVNQPATINPLASDPDGDALQYSLVACRDRTSGFPSVNYLPGFSATTPLTTTSGITLDPVTGQMSFTPAQLEVGVICIRVDEFRNGVKIGEVIRDIQVQSIACNNNNPVITPIPNQVATVGSQLCIPVTITDADGDNISASAVSSVLPPATFTITSSAPGAVQGIFCWTPTAADAGNTFPVSINAVDDACIYLGQASESFNITVPIPCNLSISATSTDETCAGTGDGAIDLSITNFVNPLSVNWSGPNGFSAVTEDVSGLSAGTYDVFVVDGNNCVDTLSVVVGEGAVNFNFQTASMDPTCGAGTDGSISISNVSGGSSPYMYSIDGGTTFSSSPGFLGLSAGTYNVVVKDSRGCMSAAQPLTLTQEVAPPLTLTCPGNQSMDADANCEGTLADYVPMVTASGGCPSVSLAQTPAAGTVLQLGTHTVTVTATDAEGTSVNCSFTVTVADNDAPTAVCQDITLVATDPQIPVVISSSDVDGGSSDNCGIQSVAVSQTSFSCSDAGVNQVTVTVTDNSGNVSTCTASVTVIDSCCDLTLVLNSANDPSCPGESDGSIDLTVTTSRGPAIISWSNGASSEDLSGLSEGTYTVTVTDAGNCVETLTITLTDTPDNTPPVLTCPGDITLQCGSDLPEPDATLVTATDQCGVASIGHLEDASNGGSGCAGDPNVISRTYMAMDVNGNMGVCVQTITIESTPIITATTPDQIIFPAFPDSSCASIGVTASGGCPPYTYLWDNGVTADNQTVCPLISTMYYVTVTDAEECSVLDSVFVCAVDITCQGSTNNGNGGTGQSGNGGTNGQGNGQGLVHIAICHIPPGQFPANPTDPFDLPTVYMNMCLPVPAAAAHFTGGHGDFLGPCESINNRECTPRDPSKTTASSSQLEESQAVLHVYPNPFREEVTFEFEVKEEVETSIVITDLSGKQIRKMYAGLLNAGLHHITWNGQNNASQQQADGVYFARVQLGDRFEMVKIILHQ